MGKINIASALVCKLISEQFPDYAHLPIEPVQQQGHDNRTYRLGDELLIRIPTMKCYALAIKKEQKFLPLLKPYLSVKVPIPIAKGRPTDKFPFPFSIYQWLDGQSLDSVNLGDREREDLAYDLATFLRELQKIPHNEGPLPGQHNWWRGAHISHYDKGARQQIAMLSEIIDANKALDLWEQACANQWQNPPVWIHGDVAPGNILIKDGKLYAVIDFGCMGLGDPACDFVMAWTFFTGKARDIFIQEMDFDKDTWLRAKAWALWKATFELCQIKDKNSPKALEQIRIIEEVIRESKT